MKEAIASSITYFDNGFGCAEAVLKAIAEYKGIECDLIPRIATGFCGGMARTNGMCGAVTGGVMAINVMLGRNTSDESKEPNYNAIQQFLNQFQKQFKDLSCPALTGLDLSNEEGLTAFKEKNLHPRCSGFVGEATRMVLEVI